MLKNSKKILKVSFFEEGGISNHALFILFIVFLFVVQIGVSFKSENTSIEIRKAEKEIFDLGMENMSLKTDLMIWYKRTIIEKKVKGSGLKSSDKLPQIIEKN